MHGLWTVEAFEADDGTTPFGAFANSLSDFKFQALDMAIKHVLAVRGLDLVGTNWLTQVGKGLHEFRIRHDADDIAKMFNLESSGAGAKREDVLLRVFVHFYGEKVILLLGGFDKSKDPKHQQREIRRAESMSGAIQGAAASQEAQPLTRHGEFPILVARRNRLMSRAYDDVVASRRAQLSSEAVAQGEILAKAYKIAVQVMDLRNKHGLTQAELAQRCDMSQADISRIERGSTSPTTRTLQRIAEALEADVRLVAHASA